MAYARTHAADVGAGTLISAGRFDAAEFAVVLEPDEPFGFAWRAFYAGMVALCEALATATLPGKPINIEWPDAIRLDGWLVGGGRLAWPDGADEAEPPSWLVFGAMIRTASMAADGSTVRPFERTIDNSAFGGDGSDCLVASFARHLMGVIDRWREVGFGSIANTYLCRLASREGVRSAIGDNGELLVTRIGSPAKCRQLQPVLAAPSWLDDCEGLRG